MGVVIDVDGQEIRGQRDQRGDRDQDADRQQQRVVRDRHVQLKRDGACMTRQAMHDGVLDQRLQNQTRNPHRGQQRRVRQ